MPSMSSDIGGFGEFGEFGEMILSDLWRSFQQLKTFPKSILYREIRHNVTYDHYAWAIISTAYPSLQWTIIIMIHGQCLWCCHHDSVIARVHPVHLMNADQRQRQTAADPQFRSTDLGCESACRLLYSLHTSSPFIITQLESWYSFTVPRRVEGWVDLWWQSGGYEGRFIQFIQALV